MLGLVSVARRAASTKNPAVTTQACTALSTQLAKVSALPAAPDPTLRTDLHNTVLAYDDAAHLCLDRSVNPAISAFARGDKWGQEVLDRLHTIAKSA
jgi:hypothetical protein